MATTPMATATAKAAAAVAKAKPNAMAAGGAGGGGNGLPNSIFPDDIGEPANVNVVCPQEHSSGGPTLAMHDVDTLHHSQG